MALTEVSAFKNLSIINDDINGSAAIDGTKISPDFGSQNIVTTGTLGAGVTTLSATGANGSNAAIKANVTGSANHIHAAQFFAPNISSGQNVQIYFGKETGTKKTASIGYKFSSDGSDDNLITFSMWNANDLVTINGLGNISVQGLVDGVDIAARDTLFGGLTSSSGVLTNGVTATTQSAGDNSTKIATTAYVDGASVSTEQVQDIVGAMFTGNTETNITATYQDSDGTIDLVASGGGGGGSSSQLTDTNGTVKVEVDTSSISLNDNVYLNDTSPGLFYRTANGVTYLGHIKHNGTNGSFDIQQRVAGKDLKIKHRSGSSYINKILLRNTGGGSGAPDVYIGQSMTTTEDGTSDGKPNGLNAMFPSSGGVELYYISGSTGTKKFETTANGITVQGSVTTEDINMSNLNANANEVDNTKGSWTIQEGASDLFLINRVNGKKYKFNLTEIS